MTTSGKIVKKYEVRGFSQLPPAARIKPKNLFKIKIKLEKNNGLLTIIITSIKS
jgi:hypothetical protein